MIKEEFGSGAFFALVAELDRISTAAVEPKPGAFGQLVAGYRASADFKDLAERTRRDYQDKLDYLRALDAMPHSEIDRGFVAGVRDRAYATRGRRFANYVVAVMSVVLSWAVEHGAIEVNPCFRMRKIKRAKDAPDANRPWTPAERDAVLAALPLHLRVPIGLCMFAGLREGDAIRITRAAYDGRDIATRTRKAGTQVWWPCPSPPKAILDESLKTLSDAVTLAVSSRGTPWTESGLRASWRKIRIGLEERGEVAPGLTLHGLRRTVATTMRELGYDDQTIADALGQKTAGMAAHYSKRADLKRKMTGVVRRLDAAENKRRKASVKTTD